MKKRLMSLVLAIFMITSLLVAIPVASKAEAYSGKCGNNLVWEFDSYTGILAIKGTGAMYNYSYSYNSSTNNSAPWGKYSSQLKSVIIKEGVTTIGTGAFLNLKFRDITIPTTIKTVKSGAFFHCFVDKVYISDIVAWCNICFEYYYSAPMECGKDLLLNGKLVENVNIRSGLSSINRYAFYGYWSLKSAIIPDGISFIDSYAFASCMNFESVFIPPSVTTINSDAFYNSTSLKNVYYGGTEEQWRKISIGVGNTCLTNANIHYSSTIDEIGQFTTDNEFEYLANNYPEYLNNSAYNNYVSTICDICYEVEKQYNQYDQFWLAYAESFTTGGTEILLKEFFSNFGLGESTQQEWQRKNTLEFLNKLTDCECVTAASWKKVKNKYKEFKFVLNGINTADSALIEVQKNAFINMVSDYSSILSYSEAKNIADRLVTKQPNGIKAFFDVADYAVDLADILLISAQTLDVQVETLETIKSNISTNSVLYQEITNDLEKIYADPSQWVIEHFIETEVVNKFIDFLDDYVDWCAGELSGADVELTSKIVKLISKGIYEYIYQGAKIDDIYGVIVACDFYTTLNISQSSLLIQLMQCKINGTIPSEDCLSDYISIFEAKRIALNNYISACKEVNKENGYDSLLSKMETDTSENGILGFDNYISVCFATLQKDVSNGDIQCNDHSMSYTKVIVPPNCTESGFTVKICYVCGKELIEDQTAALGHSYAVNEVISSTCTNQGYTHYVCSMCGNSYNYNYTPATGHNLGEWRVAVEASCDAAGKKTRTCTLCGAVVETETIPAKGHTFSNEWTTTVEPTCTEIGTKIKVCTDCGTVVDTATIPANGHTFSDMWIVDVEPTATEEGQKSRHCIRCDAVTDVTEIPPTGEAVTFGDADGDGKVNAKDITLIKKFISGLNDMNSIVLANCDTNGDGKVNMKDVTLIKKLITGAA